MRWAPWIVGALLLLVQADLWLGKGNLPYVMSLARDLQAQQGLNAALRERNARTAAEVEDLREGLEMIEERARSELRMLREHEVLVQVSPR